MHRRGARTGIQPGQNAQQQVPQKPVNQFTFYNPNDFSNNQPNHQFQTSYQSWTPEPLNVQQPLLQEVPLYAQDQQAPPLPRQPTPNDSSDQWNDQWNQGGDSWSWGQSNSAESIAQQQNHVAENGFQRSTNWNNTDQEWSNNNNGNQTVPVGPNSLQDSFTNSSWSTETPVENFINQIEDYAAAPLGKQLEPSPPLDDWSSQQNWQVVDRNENSLQLEVGLAAIQDSSDVSLVGGLSPVRQTDAHGQGSLNGDSDDRLSQTSSPLNAHARPFMPKSSSDSLDSISANEEIVQSRVPIAEPMPQALAPPSEQPRQNEVLDSQQPSLPAYICFDEPMMAMAIPFTEPAESKETIGFLFNLDGYPNDAGDENKGGSLKDGSSRGSSISKEGHTTPRQFFTEGLGLERCPSRVDAPPLQREAGDGKKVSPPRDLFSDMVISDRTDSLKENTPFSELQTPPLEAESPPVSEVPLKEKSPVKEVPLQIAAVSESNSENRKSMERQVPMDGCDSDTGSFNRNTTDADFRFKRPETPDGHDGRGDATSGSDNQGKPLEAKKSPEGDSRVSKPKTDEGVVATGSGRKGSQEEENDRDRDRKDEDRRRDSKANDEDDLKRGGRGKYTKDLNESRHSDERYGSDRRLSPERRPPSRRSHKDDRYDDDRTNRDRRQHRDYDPRRDRDRDYDARRDYRDRRDYRPDGRGSRPPSRQSDYDTERDSVFNDRDRRGYSQSRGGRPREASPSSRRDASPPDRRAQRDLSPASRRGGRDGSPTDRRRDGSPARRDRDRRERDRKRDGYESDRSDHHLGRNRGLRDPRDTRSSRYARYGAYPGQYPGAGPYYPGATGAAYNPYYNSYYPYNSADPYAAYYQQYYAQYQAAAAGGKPFMPGTPGAVAPPVNPYAPVTPVVPSAQYGSDPHLRSGSQPPQQQIGAGVFYDGNDSVSRSRRSSFSQDLNNSYASGQYPYPYSSQQQADSVSVLDPESNLPSGNFDQSSIYPEQQSGYDAVTGAYYDNTSYEFRESGYTEQSYVEPIPEPVPVPKARLTPAKFSSPHAKMVFSPGGHLVHITASDPSDGQPARVYIHDPQALFKDEPEFEELNLFPGPLNKTQTHKSDVIQFCSNKIKETETKADLYDRESAILLWQFLILLIRQNGTVVGTDISELLLKNRRDSTELTSDAGDASVVKADRSLVAPATADAAVVRFRDLVQFGHKRDALEWAIKAGLWGHALFLASKMDQKTYGGVANRFTNSLALNDPLQTLYQLMSGRQPSSVTSVTDEKWGDWRPHLAVILSNPSAGKPELDARSIVTLGDSLSGRGCLHAAQFCYLMAQCQFGDFEQKSSKLVLLGASHTKKDALTGEGEAIKWFAANEAIQCTETYEYAQTLGNEGFVLPHFQLYRFMYALRLTEFGFGPQALMYCEALSRVITRHRDRFRVDFINDVFTLADRLKFNDVNYAEGDGGEQLEATEPDWLLELKGHVTFSTNQVASTESFHTTGCVQHQTEPYEPDLTPNHMMPGTNVAGQGQFGYPVETQPTAAQSLPPAVVEQQLLQPANPPESYNSTQQQQQLISNTESYQGYAPVQQQDSNAGYHQSGYGTQQGIGGGTFQEQASFSSESSAQNSPARQPNQQTSQIPGNDYGSYGDQSNYAPAYNNQFADPSQQSGPVADGGYYSGSQHGGGPPGQGFDYYGASSAPSAYSNQQYSNPPPQTDSRSAAAKTGFTYATADYSSRSKPSSISDKSDKSSSDQNKENYGASKKGADGKNASGGTWLGGIFSKFSIKPKNQMILPDDSNPAIVWDKEQKRWINTDGDEDSSSSGPVAPPRDSDLPSTGALMQPPIQPPLARESRQGMPPSKPQVATNGGPHMNPLIAPNFSAGAVSSSSAAIGLNKYKRQPMGRLGARQNYVDVLGGNTTKSTAGLPPAMYQPSTDGRPGAMPNYFIPAPVATGDGNAVDFVSPGSVVGGPNDSGNSSPVDTHFSQHQFKRQF